MSSASPRLSDSFLRRAVSTATDVLRAFAEAAISSVRLAPSCLSACAYSDCAVAESSTIFWRSSSAELVTNLESEVPDNDAMLVLVARGFFTGNNNVSGGFKSGGFGFLKRNIDPGYLGV